MTRGSRRLLVVLSAILLGCLAPASHADDAASRATAALKRLPALRTVTLTTLTPVQGSANVFTTKIGTPGVDATVFAARAKDGTINWALAFTPTASAGRSIRTAIDLLAPDHGLPAQSVRDLLADLVLVGPTIVIAEREGECRIPEAPPALRQTLQGLGLPTGQPVPLRAGVNVATGVRVAISGMIGDFVNTLGISVPIVPLIGPLPATSAAALTGPAAGKTNLDELEIGLHFPAITPPKLEKVLGSDPFALIVKGDKGKLSVGGATSLNLQLPSGRLDVKATVTFDPAPNDGGAYVRLSGPVLPLGSVVPNVSVPGFSVDSVTLALAVIRQDKNPNKKRAPAVGLEGKGKLHGQPIDLTASLTQTPDHKLDVALAIAASLKLSDLIGAPVPGLDTVMLERISIARSRIAGTVRVGSQDITALVYTPAGKSKPNFAIGDASLALSDFVPGAKGTPLDELALVNGVLLVVPKENVAKGVATAALPADLVAMLGGPGADVLSRGLDLQEGVNVMAALDVSRAQTLHALLDAVGVKATRLPLAGRLDPTLFTYTPWKGRTGGAKALARSFFDHLNLAVPLPALALPGASKTIALKSGALAVRGDKGKIFLGIDTGADITLPDRVLTLDPLTLTVDPKGVALTGTISATSHGGGDVRQLVAFPDLTVTSVSFDGHVDTKKQLSASLTADASLKLPAGTKPIKLKVALDSGDPKAGSIQVLTALKVNDFTPTPVPGVGDLVLTNLTLTPASIAATVRYRNEDTTLLGWTPPGAKGHRFALLHDKLKIGTYVSAVAGTPLGDLELDRAAVIYVPAGGAAKAVAASALPAPLAAALGKTAFPLDLPEGVTVSATAKLPSSGPIEELLGGLGLKEHEFPLRGTFDPSYLSGAARRTGGTWPHFDVNVDLPKFQPPGTGDHVSFDKGHLRVKPNADGTYRTALSCAVTVTLDPQHVLTFTGEFTRTKPGVLSFSADAKVPLKAPFGIKWLELDEMDVSATIDRTKKTADLSVGGHTKIDGKPVTVAVELIEQGGKLQDIVFALKGHLPIKHVPGLGSLSGMDSLVLVDPEVSRTHVAAELDFRGGKIRAAMFEDPGGWNLLLQTSALRFDQLFSDAKHPKLGALSLPQSALIVSHHGFTRKTGDLPSPIQQMLGVLGLKPSDPFIAVPGVNIVTTLDPKTLTGPLKNAMDKLGVHDAVVIGGAIGGIFGGSPSLSLEAVLPKMPTPPIKFLRTRPNADFRLLLSVAPAQLRVGIGTDVNVHLGSDELTFSANLGLLVSPTDLSLDVTGNMQGAWHNPFGIKGVIIEQVSLLVGGDVTGAVDLAVGGQVNLGGDDVLVTAGAALLVEALGTPKAIGLLAKVDRLPFSALVDKAIEFVAAEAGVKLPGDHPRDLLELDDLLIAFMTPGVVLDPKLLQGVQLDIQGSGLAVAGRLKLDGKELGRVNGWASTQGLKLGGQVAPFTIGPVKLDKGVLDFQASTSGVPHFKIQTRAEPMGTQVELDIAFDGKGISFVTKDKLGGSLDIDVSAKTTNGFSLTHNDFAVHVHLKTDFVDHLIKLLAKELEAFFDELDKGVKALAADLDKANATVATRQREEAATRRLVQADRKAVVKDAKQLQAELLRLEKDANAKRREARQDRAAAEKASRAWAFLRATELLASARLADVEAAGLDVTYAATNDVLKAVEAGAQDIPLEADPRLLAAIAAREAARAHAELLSLAHLAANAVVTDLRDAASRLEHADILDVKEAKIDGTLGTTLTVGVDARVFGNPVKASGSFAPKNAVAKAASILAVAKDFATRMLTHKKLEHEHKPDPPTQTAKAGTTGPGTAPAATAAAGAGATLMTYERWMKDTGADRVTPRSPELKALDQTVKDYEGATGAARDARRTDVRNALATWKATQGPGDTWRSSVSNKNRAVEILDADVNPVTTAKAESPTGTASTQPPAAGSTATPVPSQAPASTVPHMTYERWMKETAAGPLVPRSTELKALDQAVKSYDEATDATRDAYRELVRQKLADWKKKEGPGDRWRSSVRNKNQAMTILDAEVSPAPPPAPATPATASTSPHMTYERWMSETAAGPLTQRSAELKALDQAVKSYSEATDATRDAYRELVRQKLVEWKKKEGPGDQWRSSVRNKNNAVAALDVEVNPVPSAATSMTYERWMKDTAAGALTARSTELKALDQAVKSYGEATDATRDAYKELVRLKLAEWKKKEGPGNTWCTSVRNKNRAVEVLDAEVNGPSTMLSPDALAALKIIEEHNRAALVELFKNTRLVLKNTTALGFVGHGLSTFNTARKSVQDLQKVAGPPNTAAVEAVLDELFEGDGLAARAALGSLFSDIVGAVSPFGALMVLNDWKGAVQTWRASNKTRQLGAVFAPGDPAAAFDAMITIMDREAARARRKAGTDTVKFALDTVLTGTGVGAVGTPLVAAGKALVDLFHTIHDIAIDVREAEDANLLIALGKLDVNLFKASPILGAYMLAVSDTSAVINMTTAEFGGPCWVFEIEGLVKKAQPVFDKATEYILAARYEIPQLRHMTGRDAPNWNDTTLGIPTGKIKWLVRRVVDLVQRGTDVVNQPSAGERPTGTPASTAASTEAPTHMSYERWMKETAVPLRVRGATLRALDDAIKDWSHAPDLAQGVRLRPRVRDALGQWQVETANWEGSPVNAKGAVTALLEELDRPSPERTPGPPAPTQEAKAGPSSTPSSGASVPPAAPPMTYERWMKDTAAGPVTSRSTELKELDQAVKLYDGATDATREAHRVLVRQKLEAWKKTQGPGQSWRASVRNKQNAVQILDTEVADGVSTAPPHMTYEEWRKRSVITRTRSAALRDLDAAIKDWDGAEDGARRVQLRQRVRDALGKWQVEAGDWLGSPVNANGVVTALLEELDRPTPARTPTPPSGAPSGTDEAALHTANLDAVRALAARAPEGSGLKLALTTALEASKKGTKLIAVSAKPHTVRRFDEHGTMVGYDVLYLAQVPREWERIGDLVHELTHVAVSEAFAADFVNYVNAGRRPPPNAVYSRGSDGVVYRMQNEADRQMARLNDGAVDRLVKELARLRELVDGAGLDAAQRKAVVDQITYAQPLPHIEYDTVVNQMIVWCAYWQTPTTSEFYKTLDRLVREAYARRQSRSALAEGR